MSFLQQFLPRKGEKQSQSLAEEKILKEPREFSELQRTRSFLELTVRDRIPVTMPVLIATAR